MTVENARFRAMGTVIDLQIQAEEPRPILIEAARRIKIYERRFSANSPTSELGVINAAAGQSAVVAHPQLLELITIGQQHSLASDSMLNIAIGPLTKLWRIGFPDAKVPSQREIDQALALTDPNLIEIDKTRGSVKLAKPGMSLDLGALAKGFIADLLIDFFEQTNARSALVNLGGNVVTSGSSPTQLDGLWRVGLRHPENPDEELIGALTVAEQSVVTSGVYQRQLNQAGKTFHHILDPRTGYPVDTDIASLTVVSEKSIDGEIWTSRLFGRSATKILEEIEQQPNFDALAITQGLQIHMTAGLVDSYLRCEKPT